MKCFPKAEAHHEAEFESKRKECREGILVLIHILIQLWQHLHSSDSHPVSHGAPLIGRASQSSHLRAYEVLQWRAPYEGSFGSATPSGACQGMWH